MLRRTDLPVNFSNVIQRAIDRLRHVNTEADSAAQTPAAAGNAGGADVTQRLGRLEQTLTEVNDRLKRIEEALPAGSAAQ
jgi:hypothetical protein